jgi:AraC family transcriptional regulator
VATSLSGSALRSRRIAGVRLTETLHPGGDRLAAHSHPAPFVTFVLAGGYAESRGGSSAWCTEGCAVTHEAGEVHADRFGRAATRLLNVEWEEPTDGRPQLRPRIVGGPAPRRIAASLVEEMASNDSASRLAFESLLAEIAMLDHRAPGAAGRVPAWLAGVEERLRDEYRDPPGLEELARQAGVHRSHLARSFRSHYGLTIGELVRELRVGWARARLQRGSPLAEVAIEAGFADQSHMTRWFVRLLGRSPGGFVSSPAAR